MYMERETEGLFFILYKKQKRGTKSIIRLGKKQIMKLE